MAIYGGARGPHRADIAHLRPVPIFGGLDDDTLGALAALARGRSYEGGERFTEWDPRSPAVYIVAVGSLRLVRSSLDGDEVTVLRLRMGDAFELASLDRDGQPNTVAHIRNGGATVYGLPRDWMYRTLALYPDALLRAIDLLRERLAEAYDRVEELALCKVPARLARVLLRLADDRGCLVATRSELAAWVATSDGEVIRALGALRDRGLIAFEPRSAVIRVLCPHGLARV